jgi:hypothetical protein
MTEDNLKNKRANHTVPVVLTPAQGDLDADADGGGH